MKVKLLFGIIIPLLIVIVLVVLSGPQIGFSIEAETVKEVQFISLFTNQYGSKSNVALQTITIKNDFLIPRKLELPNTIVCLNDEEGLSTRQSLNVRYSEGKYQAYSDMPIFDDLFYDYYSSKSVEVPAKSKRQVKISVEPKYIYNFDYNYDELLVIQSKHSRYSYNACQDLDYKELEKAIHISITGSSSTQTTATPITQPPRSEPAASISTNIVATRGRNIQECDTQYGTAKDTCYSDFALGTNNATMCEIILLPHTRNDCYSRIANIYGNLSLCEKISDAGNTKDYCKANTAKTLKDSTICNSIQDQYARNYCFQITEIRNSSQAP